ncbi:c-type cytochrome [Labrenzia sp. VG12]|uniref:c-type cytochrome n=1 Tax=Labrenzia sp. VG12 TaxID=2021862 RepID=UPI000B8BE1B2|nr:cytochrome c [Labrenzia sp. VG12]ASP35810.1 cytochrome C [Labrenzia sp. VG12]
MRRGFLALTAALSLTVLIVLLWGLTRKDTPSQSAAGQPLVQVIVPDLSAKARRGERLFEENCVACHGGNAAGRDGIGPPLVHKIYEPGHHADGAFYLAAQQGVRAHHWPFGNMPPVATVSMNDMESVILYVRELQRANGIF